MFHHLNWLTAIPLISSGFVLSIVSVSYHFNLKLVELNFNSLFAIPLLQFVFISLMNLLSTILLYGFMHEHHSFGQPFTEELLEKNSSSTPYFPLSKFESVPLTFIYFIFY